jgi:hypothetical protein
MRRWHHKQISRLLRAGLLLLHYLLLKKLQCNALQELLILRLQKRS